MVNVSSSSKKSWVGIVNLVSDGPVETIPDLVNRRASDGKELVLLINYWEPPVSGLVPAVASLYQNLCPLVTKAVDYMGRTKSTIRDKAASLDLIIVKVLVGPIEILFSNGIAYSFLICREPTCPRILWLMPSIQSSWPTSLVTFALSWAWPCPSLGSTLINTTLILPTSLTVS